MKNILDRIDEHIEHHDIIDSHKSDAAFLRTVKRHILNMQVKIDNLMLEYCPDEMTEYQIKEWERHQIRSETAMPEGCGSRFKDDYDN